MKLSENFYLYEYEKSSTANRHGIDNSVPEILIPSIKRLNNIIMQPLRDYFKLPMIITSGYRCPQLNKIIGSSEHSQHAKAEAVDFEILGKDNKLVFELIKESGVPYDQLILEYYKEGIRQSGWVHVSVAPITRRPRKQAFLIN